MISAQFKIQRGDFAIDVDFTIPTSGITALFGPSGCGKTSILRALAGLDRYSGCLTFDRQIWQDQNVFIPPHHRSVGFVFQEASLFPHLTVQANLEYGYKRCKISSDGGDLAQIIELLSISDLLTRKPATLSGGEKQRVAIARALAVHPEILLMDEPLTGLDLSSKESILPYLDVLHEELNIPVVYVSHSIDEVARLADHIILMSRTGLLATGTFTELMSRLDLPLSHSADAEALIEAEVIGHDDDFNLTYLGFTGGKFSVKRQALDIGDRARLRIAARDVSLTLQHQVDTSILNIFPVVITEIVEYDESQVIVGLQLEDVTLLSRITRKSADRLDLIPGKKVFAQAKSVAVLT